MPGFASVEMPGDLDGVVSVEWWGQETNRDEESREVRESGLRV